MEKENIRDLYKGMQIEEFQLTAGEFFSKNGNICNQLSMHRIICGDLCDAVKYFLETDSNAELIEEKIGDELLSLSSIASCLDISLYDVLIKKRNELDNRL